MPRSWEPVRRRSIARMWPASSRLEVCRMRCARKSWTCRVCTVCPSSIDTPLWQRGGNYSGRKIKPLDPVHPTEQVAEVVLELVRAPQREVFAGATGWILAEQHAADPELTEAAAAVFARQSLFQDAPAAPTE